MTFETTATGPGQIEKKPWSKPEAKAVAARSAENSTVDPTRSDGPRCHS
jgi:hypothetical protein